MTTAEFRRVALSFVGATEGAHMGHPDFRVSGKIFATLGYPKRGFAAIMVSPLDQDLLLHRIPKAFARAAGAWGKSGATTVLLRVAPRQTVTLALEAAWRRRAPKQFVSDHPACEAQWRRSGRDEV